MEASLQNDGCLDPNDGCSSVIHLHGICKFLVLVLSDEILTVIESLSNTELSN